jgi:hypothetical protein
MDFINRRASVRWAPGAQLHGTLPEGALRSLLVDGIIAGVGSVLVFLPQILILFFFILALEDSGYLPRAAYLLDRLMGISRPLWSSLHSHCCRASPAPVPGIMATRTIPNLRDRHGHDHDRAADDVRRPAARLRSHHCRVYPEPPGRLVQPAGAGAVHAVFRRHRGSDGGGVRAQAHGTAVDVPPADAGTAGVSLAAREQPADRAVGARQDLPAARRHHHLWHS